MEVKTPLQILFNLYAFPKFQSICEQTMEKANSKFIKSKYTVKFPTDPH